MVPWTWRTVKGGAPHTRGSPSLRGAQREPEREVQSEGLLWHLEGANVCPKEKVAVRGPTFRSKTEPMRSFPGMRFGGRSRQPARGNRRFFLLPRRGFSRPCIIAGVQSAQPSCHQAVVPAAAQRGILRGLKSAPGGLGGGRSPPVSALMGMDGGARASYFTRSTYSPVRVSIFNFWPRSTNSGT